MGGASDRESNLVEPNEARSAALVAFLSSPEAYGGGATSAVSVAETHISWVFLTDSHAYKVKKPVRFPFLDYSTLEQRRQACRDEVRLNNRLAAGTYRGVVPICESPGGKLKLAGEGDVIEYCVQMQRLPADRMLDRLIHDGRATGADIDRLLGILVPFYRSVAHGPEIAEHGSARAIEANARENMNLLEAPDHFLPRATLQRVRASQLQFLQLRAELFAKRAAMGRVCEGHGDLRPEHVCMMEQPVVFDCLEFSLALRSADVANELAFLAMEFDYLGVPELGHTLINGYRAQSGDDVPDGLVSFFKSYRACVRGKVEELRAAQQTNAAAERSRARARRYLQLASSYAAEFYRPKVFVMVGASGTGKSTICEALSNALGLEILRTDAVRRELAGFRQPGRDLLRFDDIANLSNVVPPGGDASCRRSFNRAGRHLSGFGVPRLRGAIGAATRRRSVFHLLSMSARRCAAADYPPDRTWRRPVGRSSGIIRLAAKKTAPD
jgi:aminoglycoside phosphotransferase family enzyme